MIAYSTNDYLSKSYTDNLFKSQPWHQGMACRLWSISFILENIVGKTVLDVLCGKNIIGSYLINKGYDAVGLDMGIGAFQHANTAKTKKIIYNKNFPIFMSPASSMPFGDDSFDTVYTNDIFRWLCKDQRWLSSGFRFLTDGEIWHCRTLFEELLYEVMRVAKKRIIIVDRVNIPTGDKCTKNLRFKEVIKMLRANDWLVKGRLPSNNLSPLKDTLIEDQIRRKLDRKTKFERATYYFLGIIAERKQ